MPKSQPKTWRVEQLDSWGAVLDSRTVDPGEAGHPVDAVVTGHLLDDTVAITGACNGRSGYALRADKWQWRDDNDA